MQNTISLDDVLSSAEKFGDDKVLTHNLKKVRDLMTINPKSKFDTTYIPLLFKHINGKLMDAKIKISEQIISSSAKVPQGSDDESKDENKFPKHLNIAFMQMSREDVEGGDYVPKDKETKEEQEKENTRVSENIDRYLLNNKKLLAVLDIMDKSYKNVCADLIAISDADAKKKKDKTLNFRLKKSKVAAITIFSIKQTTRLDKDTNIDEELEHPIYRIKVPVCKKDGRIGIWSNYNNAFKPTVFDARKMTKKNNYKETPAKVKCQGKLRDLDVNNASSFITYKSLIGGIINFECVTASKFGLSLNNSFYNLFVFRHKSKTAQQSMTEEEIVAMRGGCAEESDDDSDAELEVRDDGDGDNNEEYDDEDHDGEDHDDNDEPKDSDDEEDEQEPEPEPEPIKTKKRVLKKGSKKVKKQESEESVDE